MLVANEPEESSTHWAIIYTNAENKEIYTNPAGELAVYLPGYTPSLIKPEKSVALHDWRYVAMVLDGKSVALYVDGNEVVRKEVTPKASGTPIEGPLTVGHAVNQGGGTDCNGVIDELRISRGVKKIVKKRPADYAPFTVDEDTVGLWRFDVGENDPGSFADLSPHNTPLVVGAPHGPSKNELDRASYGAGPSPLDSPAQRIDLREGPVPVPSAPPVYSLDGEWELVQAKDLEDRLAGAWDGSMPAPVPGSVHTALARNGIIPDPYFGKNQEIVKEWSDKTYYYRKTFRRPPQGQDDTLVFEGLCNRATIWLNGRQLGEHEGMFIPVEYPVRDLLEEENTLVVRLDPAVPWYDTVVFNNTYGWHYAKFPPLGIWRPVFLRGEPGIRMHAPFVSTRDAAGGVLDLVADLDPGGSGKIVGVIEPENFTGQTWHFEQEVRADEGVRPVHLQFVVPDPQLWWPVDMGQPNLYRFRLAFVPEGSGAPDAHDFHFGIRTVEMRPVNGREHSTVFNWTLVINGRPMFVKGAGWCTLDAMMDFSRARYDHFLSLAVDQHIQMLRAWGAGMVETDDFYDLCDRKGIMVLQEWPTSWNSHKTDKQPPGLLERTVREGILRLRNHPSLVLYGAGNESADPFGASIDMMGRLSIELDGTREFHRGQPAGGSIHDYSVYWGREHLDNNFQLSAVHIGEFGAASFPVHESVQRYLPGEDKALWPPPAEGSFAYHTPTFNKDNKDMDCLNHMAGYFTAGAGMEDFIRGTQVGQAVNVRHTLERARTRWPSSAGALYYKLNDNVPAASWATVDWYGAPKLAHYLIKHSFAPLVAVGLFERESSTGQPLKVPIYLLDDAGALADRSWEVTVRAYGADLKLIKAENFTGRGGIGNVQRLGDFALDAEQTRTNPLLLVLDVLVDGQLAQRNYNFTNCEPVKDCLFNLPPGRASMTTEDGRVAVRNTGDVPLVAVHVSRPGHAESFRASDNYLWLDPGEVREIQVNATEGLKLEGWNLP